jgi:hypothetical protein
MNVEIGPTLFPEKEYINGIAVAVYASKDKMSRIEPIVKNK